MRPRKKVLLIGPSELDVLALAYVLNSKGWCACSAVTAAKPLASHLRSTQFDAALIFGASDSIRMLRRRQRECRVMVVGAVPDAGCVADVQVLRVENNAEIIEMLRILTARKRGPTPKHR